LPAVLAIANPRSFEKIPASNTDRQLSEPHFATNLYERTDQKLSFFLHLTHQRELLASSEELWTQP
jgi:hypothetical protein